jgi:hypothetical protein
MILRFSVSVKQFRLVAFQQLESDQILSRYQLRISLDRKQCELNMEIQEQIQWFH